MVTAAEPKSLSGIQLTEVHPDEIIARLPRPASLAGDRDAYALAIAGDSMWPRFRPDRRIAVSPKAAVAIGDDVVVRLRLTGASSERRLALVKELVNRTKAGIHLRQFKPALSFTVDQAQIEAIDKVVGELI